MILVEKELAYIAVVITIGVFVGLILKFYQLFVQTDK
jgi:hypothetical protein